MRVKFIKQGSNTAVGGFGPGDRATVSDALAKHLVEEAGVAEYAETVEDQKPAPSENKSVAPARSRAKGQPSAAAKAPASNASTADQAQGDATQEGNSAGSGEADTGDAAAGAGES